MQAPQPWGCWAAHTNPLRGGVGQAPLHPTPPPSSPITPPDTPGVTPKPPQPLTPCKQRLYKYPGGGGGHTHFLYNFALNANPSPPAQEGGLHATPVLPKAAPNANTLPGGLRWPRMHHAHATPNPGPPVHRPCEDFGASFRGLCKVSKAPGARKAGGERGKITIKEAKREKAGGGGGLQALPF